MIDSELQPFLDVFMGVFRVFPKRLEPTELHQMGTSYFKAMRRFQLHQVADGAEVWVQRGKFFPKPAEWIESIPSEGRGLAAEVEPMSTNEILEYEDAERRFYDGDPCRCDDCRAAGVDHRFIRFVPRFDAQGQTVQGKKGDKVVTRGRWIHGWELRRWYAAKEGFWSLYERDVKRRSMPKVDIAAVTADVAFEETARYLGEK